MKKLDVVIPTYRRVEKLIECIHSVEEARSNCNPLIVHLHLYFSDMEELERVKNEMSGNDWVSCHMLHAEFKAPDFWNSHLYGMDAEAMCYLTDDVLVDPYCLMEAWNCLASLDFDGVVGFKDIMQTTQKIKAAFGMVGKDFTGRFPNRQVFCPDYWCFYIDEELEKFAESVGRFRFCQKAQICHFHPSFTGKDPDETHIHHRRHAMKDQSVYATRKEENLLWGRDFKLLTKGKE